MTHASMEFILAWSGLNKKSWMNMNILCLDFQDNKIHKTTKCKKV